MEAQVADMEALLGRQSGDVTAQAARLSDMADASDEAGLQVPVRSPAHNSIITMGHLAQPSRLSFDRRTSFTFNAP